MRLRRLRVAQGRRQEEEHDAHSFRAAFGTGTGLAVDSRDANTHERISPEPIAAPKTARMCGDAGSLLPRDHRD
jgi:hypothetical protein